MLRKYCFVVLLAGLALVLFSCTKRKPEEIDYAPNLPCNPYPADSSTNIDHTTLDVTLSWTASDPNSGDVLTYEIFFDTLNPPMTNIASDLASPSFFVTGLNYNTTYYWKVFAKDQEGASTASAVWRFTTLPHANSAPNVPSYLYPVDNATWQYPTLNFGWNCTDPQGSSDTLYYDFYLGVTPQPPLVSFKNDSILTREISGLNYTTTYYWKILAHDNHEAYTSGSLYSFVTRNCPWFYKMELPSPRYGFGTAVVNGRIYIIGGTDSAGYMSINSLNEVLEYDPLLDTWVRKADMPTARSDLAVTVWNDKIYAMGGQTNNIFLRNNEVYDPLLNTWSSLTPIPGNISSVHAINGNIYTLDTVFLYNINTDVWWDTTVAGPFGIGTIHTYSKSSLPHCNSCFGSVVYNNLIYVFSGTYLGDFIPYVDVYHPEANLWTSACDMPAPADYSAAVATNDFIYVLGGYDGIYSKRVRKYDPVTDTWFIRSDLLTGRSHFGAAFTAGCIYAIGGVSSFPISTVEEYQLGLDPKNTGR